ncbi:hypothetical protein FRC17_003520 [Serendipita sp. 399]|nr:hypothetical protein FRC17_003520 [Serendipita sp. 399]
MIPSAMECPIAHQDKGHLTQQQLAEQSSASQSGESNQPNPPILGEHPHTMNREPIPEPPNRQGEQIMAPEATIRPIEPDRSSSPTARTRPLVYAIIPSKLGDISEHNTRKALTRTKLMRMIDDLSIRAILTVIFGSIWWKQDEIEPEAAYNSLIETLIEGYRCKICSHEKTRWDRALAHIRKHVEHRPFACTGRTCGNDKKW